MRAALCTSAGPKAAHQVAMVAVLAVDAHEVREQIAALRVSCMMVQGAVVVQAVGATQVGSPGPTVQSVHVRS